MQAHQPPNSREPVLGVRAFLRLGAFSLDIGFSIGARFTALFGPSGCGKTTTLKVIAGLLRPERGHIRLNGRCLFDSERDCDLPPEQRGVGLVFQDARLFPHMTVEENLRFALKYIRQGQQRFDFDEVVRALQLQPLLTRKPRSLSGGETQRVAIGRMLLAAPDILLLDEPMAALDIPTRLHLLTELRDIHERFRLPMLYVSHDLATVLNIADEVLLMQKGRITGQGAPETVLADYISTGLLATETVRNIIHGHVVRHDDALGTTTIRANGIELVLPRVQRAPEQAIKLELPASEIILATVQPQQISARNVLRGTVRNILQIGNRTLVRVDAGLMLTVEIVEATVQALNLKEGCDVFMIIKATAFRLLN